MNNKTFHMTSLGCAKNSVDTDSMAQLLKQAGYRQVKTPMQAQILIVNTCGFIKPACQESYLVLQTLTESKRPGQVLLAAGCLTQRYGANVASQVPGIDGIIGTRRWMDVVEVVQRLNEISHSKPLFHLPEAAIIGKDPPAMDGLQPVMRASIAGASAYLKIADGCRRSCAYCTIPMIKGTTISRPINAIVNEVQRLQEMGVNELVIIAQDTTDYGHDFGLKDGLCTLLESILEKATQIKWIRIMYAYPGYISDRFIELMSSHSQILPYLDIPLQHAHPETLKRMCRPANIDWVYNTITKMRSCLSGLTIRSTFIVGFPGETEEEFQTLLDFIKDIRFDHVGAFHFSFEAGSPCESLGDPVLAQVKEERYQRLMTLQQKISLQINQSLIGQTLDVLIEGFKKGISIGRSYRDAPEVDGLVFAEGKAAIGSIVPVQITTAMAYDLIGVIASR